MSVKVRFAPSPTGRLHVGGARTALFNYYFARHHGGVFCLRIEDTDRERSTAENEADILESLTWLGLKWDEPLVYQSKRTARYQEVAEQLLAQGKVYRCYCSSHDLEQMREQMQKQGLKPMYDRRCRNLEGDQPGKPYVLRFKSPLEGDVQVNDAIAGSVSFQAKELDDFVIARSDGAPTYQFCVVVDDVDMKITHVIRGDDHLNNTPKQILLYRAMERPLPVFAHLPMILGADKAKLSKRHGAVSTTVYREMGFLPEAMRSYMIRLGWGHGDQELFSEEDLVKLFDLDGCRQSAAVFDVKKLEWVNQHFMKQRTLEDLVSQTLQVTSADLSPLLSSDIRRQLLQGLVERSTTLPQLAKLAQTFLGDEVPYELETVEKVLKDYPKEVLLTFAGRVEALAPGATPEQMHQVLDEVVQGSGLGFGKVAKPLRVLVTGGLQSPDLSLVLAALGPQKVQQRLRRGIARF